LGYQFSFTHRTNNNGYFNSVPLTPDIRAHYLTAFFNNEITDDILIENNAFIGEDTKRNLHLFKGDLWGVGSRVKWNVNNWFYVNSSYNFGRETISGITGDNHQLQINITGHWN